MNDTRPLPLPLEPASTADLASFGIAHFTDEQGGTGCTVIVAPKGATCGVDVRGGAPATRETDLLKPENTIEAVHAVVLSGGSAFGLAASTGVADALAEHGIGFRLGSACVPIVVEACLFDLLVGENTWPRPDAAADATMRALEDAAAKRAGAPSGARSSLEEGNVGAGTGASVGKLLGPDGAMKSGFGVSGVRFGELVAVALVAVNACGNVCDRTGRWIAGCRGEDGTVMEPLVAMIRAAEEMAALRSDAETHETDGSSGSGVRTNTTIGCVLTNARLTKAQATKASSMAHDAYARAIRPVHTTNDGDTIFTFASGEVEAPVDVVGALACEAMQDAIISAVIHATAAYGLPAAGSMA